MIITGVRCLPLLFRISLVVNESRCLSQQFDSKFGSRENGVLDNLIRCCVETEDMRLRILSVRLSLETLTSGRRKNMYTLLTSKFFLDTERVVGLLFNH